MHILPEVNFDITVSSALFFKYQFSARASGLVFVATTEMKFGRSHAFTVMVSTVVYC